jgi:hypothetical protein
MFRLGDVRSCRPHRIIERATGKVIKGRIRSDTSWIDDFHR